MIWGWRLAQHAKSRPMVSVMKNCFPFLLLICSLALFVNGASVLAKEGDEDHGGDIIYTKPLKAVIFSHEAHTQDIGLQCDWCHEETFEMEALNMQENGDHLMESLCNERYCGTCHNGDISFSTTTQCARCHIGVKGYNKLLSLGKIEPEKALHTEEEKGGSGDSEGTSGGQKEGEAGAVSEAEKHKALEKIIQAGYYPEDITMPAPEGKLPAKFSHKKHADREHQRCTECHPKIFKMKAGKSFYKNGQIVLTKMQKGKYCGRCHDGDNAFSVTSPGECDKCHHK